MFETCVIQFIYWPICHAIECMIKHVPCILNDFVVWFMPNFCCIKLFCYAMNAMPFWMYAIDIYAIELTCCFNFFLRIFRVFLPFFVYFCRFLTIFIMSINVYTATQTELQSLTGFGPKSASEIVALWNQVLAGQRDPICILDLAEIRLQPDTWQQYINDGLFSITYTAPYQPLAEVFESADDGFGNIDEPIHIKEELTPILPAPKHTLTLEQAT